MKARGLVRLLGCVHNRRKGCAPLRAFIMRKSREALNRISLREIIFGSTLQML